MKSYILASFSDIARILSLLLQGYLFGSKFARFEFRRSFLRPALDATGAVGAWILTGLACAAGCAALYGLLWLAYIIGFDM